MRNRLLWFFSPTDLYRAHTRCSATSRRNAENQFCHVEHFLTLRLISCRKRRARKRMNKRASSAHESKIISAYCRLYAPRLWAAARCLFLPHRLRYEIWWVFAALARHKHTHTHTLNKRLPAMNDASANNVHVSTRCRANAISLTLLSFAQIYRVQTAHENNMQKWMANERKRKKRCKCNHPKL